MKKRLVQWLVWGLLGACAPVPMAAQEPRAGEAPGVSSAEIQSMFDAYVLVQAQRELRLSDAQYPQFLARFKALQDTRRRGQQDRLRLLQELRRMSERPRVDEARLRDRLKSLQDLEERAELDIRKASAGVDEVLDLRQQVTFRFFEEQMERRKIDLMARARRNGRPMNR